MKPEALKGPLRSCGYRRDLLRADFRFGDDASVPLVGFAQVPADARSACLAVLSHTAEPRKAVEACRPLGTPVVFVCFEDTLQWWKQGATSAEWLESVPAREVDQFFEAHKEKFSPDAVYRAKTWGRFRTEYQLTFVDLGLMPLVEEEVGEELGRLIEQSVTGLKKRLGWSDVTGSQGHWLLKTVFWLVSGKILSDKQVSTFENLDLNDVDDVFSRVATHFGTEPFVAGSKKKLTALGESAHTIDQFSSLALTTTESLAYVYENTLISKKTRSALGTHSTPSFLVDYVVGNLAEWIREIPENERSVFEPACGHASFLVSAMRLLAELLPAEKAIPSRRGPYLRSRLHGTDIDSFALELARLSLSLTDIPNPDGWDLKVQDMYIGDRLSEQAELNTILLANPPFADFKPEERECYANEGVELRFKNRAAEMLWRTIPKLTPGSVFGVVLPQTFLHSDNAVDVRRFLLEHCELKEICLFPDKVFKFSDAESAVLIGRRLPSGSRHPVSTRYRHVRESQMPTFRQTYEVPSSRTVMQSRFEENVRCVLRISDLEEVWSVLSNNPKVNELATFGQGLFYRGRNLQLGVQKYSEERFPRSKRGFVTWKGSPPLLHSLPKPYWMNLDVEAIDRKVAGATIGVPQVILNYAPVSRGAWRLKALVDRIGHPVTSRFIAIRPREDNCPLELLWALLNSPVANAFAFTHLSKRDNIVGEIRQIPIPYFDSFADIENAAKAYLDAAAEGQERTTLQDLLLRVDVEVLKLYSLPLKLEWALLGLFNKYDRVGVPFKQTRYFPEELDHPMHLADFLQFEEDWSVTNRERGRLIDKNIAGTISVDEKVRLDALQAYADYYLDKVAPRPTHVLDELEDRLFASSADSDKDV